MFTYADLMRRIDALEQELVKIRRLLEASSCVPITVVDGLRERRTDVLGNEVTGP